MTRRPTHPPDDDWRASAACRGTDARLFTDPESPDDVRQALDTCATCSVRAACLATALRHPPEADVGIWGGTSEETRRRIRAEGLTVEQALNQGGHGRPGPRKHGTNGSVGHRHPEPTVTHARSTPRPSAPELTVARDANGDYVSPDGRVIIFQIHGEPPWMLMVDQRCVARTLTVTEARRIAGATLDDERQASIAEPQAHKTVAPALPSRRR